MQEERALEILKMAILLEKKGKAFYSHVAKQAEDEAVKEFFQSMAEEEDEHIKVLQEQFKSFTENKKFVKMDYKPEEESTDEAILTEKVKQRIQDASFEAAAISSAIDMENRAVKIYTERAQTADTQEEKDFYQWLADWESGHGKLLHEIDKSLRERVWNDNNFWPF